MNAHETSDRELTAKELDAVSGGVINCTPPTEPIPTDVRVGDWTFVDQFASILPSWVRQR
jgi:hypothetical protein